MNPTWEECEYLAKYGKTDEMATKFADLLLEMSLTRAECEHLAEYGKTDEIKRKFKTKLKEIIST